MTAHPTSWGPQRNADGQTTFSLWAPERVKVHLDLEGGVITMTRHRNGWHSAEVSEVAPGTRYQFRFESGTAFPDPASRHQPEGVNGPSAISISAYDWKSKTWAGLPWEEAIIYELHIGAFTQEGTFMAALEHLPRLASLGFTAIEILPIAQFPGRWGWGYDGVFQYAPHYGYGEPDDFRRFIDEAHASGLMVFLDVVYNHFGPEGNVLPICAPTFFREGDDTPWGPRIAFEIPAVRRYFIDNVLYWLEDFRLDGLRFDAVNEISDKSDTHILQEISDIVHARFANRHVHLITENPSNGTDLIAATQDGRALFVADWNDDFHHAVHVAVTGEASGFYEAFKDAPWQEVKHALAAGYLHACKRTLDVEPPPSASLPPTAFVHFLQNHDQVGNRALGDRLHTSLDVKVYRLITEILLLSPQIPLLFMGDDHLSPTPFRFFADYNGDLAHNIFENRFAEAENFGGYPKGFGPDDVADPNDATTFESSKIDWNISREPTNRAWAAFLRSLIAVRRQHVVPLARQAGAYAGSMVSDNDREIFIDWQLGGNTLSLRANASSAAVELTQERGKLLYSTDQETSPHYVLAGWTTKLFRSSSK